MKTKLNIEQVLDFKTRCKAIQKWVNNKVTPIKIKLYVQICGLESLNRKIGYTIELLMGSLTSVWSGYLSG